MRGADEVGVRRKPHQTACVQGYDAAQRAANARHTQTIRDIGVAIVLHQEGRRNDEHAVFHDRQDVRTGDRRVVRRRIDHDVSAGLRAARVADDIAEARLAREIGIRREPQISRRQQFDRAADRIADGEDRKRVAVRVDIIRQQ